MKDDFGFCYEFGCENRTSYGYCRLTYCNKEQYNKWNMIIPAISLEAIQKELKKEEKK